jgi:hypothetical protein
MAHEQELSASITIVGLGGFKKAIKLNQCALGRANIKPKGGIPQTKTPYVSSTSLDHWIASGASWRPTVDVVPYGKRCSRAEP